ncbi:hypothetical protein BGW42_005501, partial [Actinomortierella wolfii]
MGRPFKVAEEIRTLMAIKAINGELQTLHDAQDLVSDLGHCSISEQTVERYFKAAGLQKKRWSKSRRV